MRDPNDRMTDEQEKKYLEGGALFCPFCGCEDISGGPVEIESGCAWQEVDCAACNATWQDVYTLTSADSIDYSKPREQPCPAR